MAYSTWPDPSFGRGFFLFLWLLICFPLFCTYVCGLLLQYLPFHDSLKSKIQNSLRRRYKWSYEANEYVPSLRERAYRRHGLHWCILLKSAWAELEGSYLASLHNATLSHPELLSFWQFSASPCCNVSSPLVNLAIEHPIKTP
jgi:hypothetical protein